MNQLDRGTRIRAVAAALFAWTLGGVPAPAQQSASASPEYEAILVKKGPPDLEDPDSGYTETVPIPSCKDDCQVYWVRFARRIVVYDKPSPNMTVDGDGLAPRLKAAKIPYDKIYTGEQRFSTMGAGYGAWGPADDVVEYVGTGTRKGIVLIQPERSIGWLAIVYPTSIGATWEGRLPIITKHGDYGFNFVPMREPYVAVPRDGGQGLVAKDPAIFGQDSPEGKKLSPELTSYLLQVASTLK